METLQNESKLFGVSVRGWLAVMVVFTICVMSMMQLAIPDPLANMGSMALGFYLGQKLK